MPPNHHDPTEPAEWLRRAQSDLALARIDRGQSDILYEDLCFHTQQAAEKAVKAVLVRQRVEFPKTHSIADLLTLAANNGVQVPVDVREAARLTRYAVETRYPGTSEDVTETDHERAVELAERMLRWAESTIASSNESL